MLTFSQFTLVLTLEDLNAQDHDIDLDYTMYVGLKVFTATELALSSDRLFAFDSTMLYSGGVQTFGQVSMTVFLLGALTTLF